MRATVWAAAATLSVVQLRTACQAAADAGCAAAASAQASAAGGGGDYFPSRLLRPLIASFGGASAGGPPQDPSEAESDPDGAPETPPAGPPRSPERFGVSRRLENAGGASPVLRWV